MEVIKKRTRVHRLPTEDKSDIIENNSLDFIYHSSHKDYSHWGVEESKHLSYQHLYFTTDEEIKKGDWVYWTDPEGLTSDINQVVSVDEEMIFISHPEHSETEAFPHECKKIIATTDPKLTVRFEGHEYGTAREINAEVYLPQPSHSFIEEYCKAVGINEVLVEYESWDVPPTTAPFLDDGELKGIKLPSHIVYTDKPKTDSNNCIIIHPVEENIYNVNRQVFLKLVHDVGDSLSQKDSIGFNLDKWIKENL